jgi:hypothetical protein
MSITQINERRIVFKMTTDNNPNPATSNVQSELEESDKAIDTHSPNIKKLDSVLYDDMIFPS